MRIFRQMVLSVSSNSKRIGISLKMSKFGVLYSNKVYCIFFFLFLKKKEAKKTFAKNRFAVFRRIDAILCFISDLLIYRINLYLSKY